jgi:PHD/YefM family antitoxin component YafN of YafNO toxin-antitoxin module
MQTLSVQIQDDYMQQFMDFVKNSHSNITISKDKNLEFDPYFYERKKDLEQIIEESENGTMEMLSQEQYDQEMEMFFKDLKANANL